MILLSMLPTTSLSDQGADNACFFFFSFTNLLWDLEHPGGVSAQ